MSIRGMIDAVVREDIWNGKWVNTFKAANVVTILARVGTTLMVRVDTAI
jgi:hypothetical protein